MIAALSVTLYVVERVIILETMEYTEFELHRVLDEKKSFSNVIHTCVMQLEDAIRDTIKDRWLSSRSVDGGSITNKGTGNSSYARLSYKALKIQRNPSAGGKVDLTFTGSLGDKIKVIKSDSGDYEIISTDPKYTIIGKMYGFEEFGLSNDEYISFMKMLEVNINSKL